MDRRSGVKLAVLACSFAHLAAGQAPEPLRVGAPVERAIRPQESHRYRVHLDAGQLLHVTALQKGADIVLTVGKPDGGEAARSDLPNGGAGIETIAVRAAAAGDYGVSVSGAGPWPEGSRYELRIEAARDGSAGDAELLA